MTLPLGGYLPGGASSNGGAKYAVKGDLMSHDGAQPVIVPLGGVDGQVATRSSAAPSGIVWQAPNWLANAFAVAYAVDFSTLPAQNLLTGGDGVKTIDSRPWTLANTASLATAALQPGNGLYLRCNAVNSNNFAAQLNAGAIYAKHVDLASSLQLGGWTERWTWFNLTQPHTPNAVYEWYNAGLITFPATYAAANLNRFNAIRGYSSSGLCYGGHISFAGGGNLGPALTYWATAYDVVVVREVGTSIEVYVGSMVAGAWPTLANLIMVVRGNVCGTAGVPAFEGLGPWVSTMSGNTAGASDLMLKQMRVMVK